MPQPHRFLAARLDGLDIREAVVPRLTLHPADERVDINFAEYLDEIGREIVMSAIAVGAADAHELPAIVQVGQLKRL